MRNSVMSLTGSLPHSFIHDPHPAALTITASTLARSIASIALRSNFLASLSRPACADNAPQQPRSGGTTTSQPSADSTRIVASLTDGKYTRCTQPASNATRARGGPFAGVNDGNLAVR